MVKAVQSEYETDSLHVRRLSLSPFERINALTAIQADSEGRLYVGTTSEESEAEVLFRVDPRTCEIEDTGFRFPPKDLPGTYGYSIGDKVHSALEVGAGRWAGWFLIGHGSHIWWNEGGWPMHPDHFDGGHLYAYHPKTGELRDLGLPVRLNTVHGLCASDTMAVGYSLPDNHFFVYDIQSEAMVDWGRVSGYCCHNYVIWRGKAFGAYLRAHGEQRGDLMISAKKAAFLLVYDHEARRMDRTEVELSDVDLNIRHNVGIDSWTASHDAVYGGRVDGSLFRLDPVTWELREYGRPVEPPDTPYTRDQVNRLGGLACEGFVGNERLPAMSVLPDGRILGIAGFPVMHVFALDPEEGRSTDYGAVPRGLEMAYFHGSALFRADDGRLALAAIETDSRRPDLYIVQPKAGSWG